MELYVELNKISYILYILLGYDILYTNLDVLYILDISYPI